MGLMTNELNNQIRNDAKTFGYNLDQHMHHSELKLFDYANGQVGTMNGKEHYNVGIDAGKSIMIVGKSGSGKSSFAVQMAASVMKQYEESTMFIFDFEQSHTPDRIKSITGMSDEYFDEHVTINKVGIYTETVLKLVKQIAKFKKDHEKELLTDNKEGVVDKDGKLVKILPPTFIIIDSIASMRTKDAQDGDEMSSLTAGARNAIANKDLFNRMLQPCMEANIIVISVNHVNTNIGMGVTPPTAQSRYMKNTESVSGGVAILYLSNLWVNVEACDKLEEKDKFGIKGFVSKVTIVKSRNAEAGRSFKLIFNQREGYDEQLSEFEFLKENGLIKGAGVGMYLDGLDTVKFRMANIKEKLATVPEFKERFDELVQAALESSVSVSSKIQLAEPEEEPEEMEILNEEVPAEALTEE